MYALSMESPLRSHAAKRLGWLVKPFDAKNSCSPAVKVKGAPQSEHVIDLSSKLIVTSSLNDSWLEFWSPDTCRNLRGFRQGRGNVN